MTILLRKYKILTKLFKILCLKIILKIFFIEMVRIRLDYSQSFAKLSFMLKTEPISNNQHQTFTMD